MQLKFFSGELLQDGKVKRLLETLLSKSFSLLELYVCHLVYLMLICTLCPHVFQASG